MITTAPTAGTMPDKAASITVLISPVIEREFKRRDVFPELRLEHASRIQNGATGIYKVNGAVAAALLADAESMARTRDLPRGLPVAYGSLVRNLERALREEARRGLWDDPGMEEMKKRAAQSPARLEVGDKALFFGDDDEYGAEVVVVKAFDMYGVLSDEGAYISVGGQRISYRCGYLVKGSPDEREFFSAAHRLTRNDCRPTHLCLVASRC